MDTFPPEYVKASNAGRIVGVVGVFYFIALTFVSLRVYVRVVLVRAFGVDDALIIASAVSSDLLLIPYIDYEPAATLLTRNIRRPLHWAPGSVWYSKYLMAWDTMA